MDCKLTLYSLGAAGFPLSILIFYRFVVFSSWQDLGTGGRFLMTTGSIVVLTYGTWLSSQCTYIVYKIVFSEEAKQTQARNAEADGTSEAGSQQDDEDEEESKVKKYSVKLLKMTARGTWKLAKGATENLIKLVGRTFQSMDAMSREVMAAKQRRRQRRIREIQGEQYFELTSSADG